MYKSGRDSEGRVCAFPEEMLHVGMELWPFVLFLIAPVLPLAFFSLLSSLLRREWAKFVTTKFKFTEESDVRGFWLCALFSPGNAVVMSYYVLENGHINCMCP